MRTNLKERSDLKKKTRMKLSIISEAHKKGEDLIVTIRKELSKRQSDKVNMEEISSNLHLRKSYFYQINPMSIN